MPASSILVSNHDSSVMRMFFDCTIQFFGSSTDTPFGREISKKLLEALAVYTFRIRQTASTPNPIRTDSPSR